MNKTKWTKDELKNEVGKYFKITLIYHKKKKPEVWYLNIGQIISLDYLGMEEFAKLEKIERSFFIPKTIKVKAIVDGKKPEIIKYDYSKGNHYWVELPKNYPIVYIKQSSSINFGPEFKEHKDLCDTYPTKIVKYEKFLKEALTHFGYDEGIFLY